MKKGEKKSEKMKVGMENLSEEGRIYIKNLTEAMVLYQNSLVLSGAAAAGRPDKAKTPPDAAEPGGD
jgi:hypothetical protein